MTQRYDIVGDIHGNADALVALLEKMGYERTPDGVWGHNDRQAIFVGDFVDIGPKQVETVMTVKRMVEAGTALAVMGNHDLNAIAWYLPDPAQPGEYLRPHFSAEWGEKNRKQHSAFLAEVEGKPELHREIIDWFLTLPLWLDLPELRIVHACWHSRFIEYLTPILRAGGELSVDLMPAATSEPAEQEPCGTSTPPSVFRAVEALTKGIEIPLPAGAKFYDKYGIERDRVRSQWWNEHAQTYQTGALLDDSLRLTLADQALPETARVFEPTRKPVFIGHYWRTGKPTLLSDKVVCVDYSVARGGPLCAYRWDGDATLDEGRFVCAGAAAK